MTTVLKFPSINQFRQTIKSVRDYAKYNNTPLSVLRFTGTIKLHGTNAAVRYNAITDELVCQSRERIITAFDDNAGFARFVHDNQIAFKRAMEPFTSEDAPEVILFGEWAGKGVKNTVAVGELEKAFYVFDGGFVQYDVDANPTFERMDWEIVFNIVRKVFPSNVYSIFDFPSFVMDIDFNRPELSQNELVQITIDVETQCPVAKSFGVDGIGEGVVWYHADSGLRFKVKGEKHSTTKVKTIKAIAAVDLERLASVAEFVDSVVTDNRLNQGIDKLGEMGLFVDITSMGPFLKWVAGDVLKEEMDLILESCIDKKELMHAISTKAKAFFMFKLNDLETV